MTDRFHYQDVFQKINIPEKEQVIAFQAKSLFDVATSEHDWNPDAHACLDKIIDTEYCSQAFWKVENDTHGNGLLVLTMMKRGLTIAIASRDLAHPQDSFRRSLHIENGTAAVFNSEGRIRNSLGDRSEQAVSDFSDSFMQTTARLGLSGYIERNESNSAIFASAA